MYTCFKKLNHALQYTPEYVVYVLQKFHLSCGTMWHVYANYIVFLCVGSSRQQIHRQLCKLVSDTSLGEILISVQEDGQCEELYRRYIHDFVHSVHKCTHKQNETVKHEYKVCVYKQLFPGLPLA